MVSRIEGPRPVAAADAGRKTEAASGFTVPTQSAAAPRAAAPLSAAPALSTILALQGGDPRAETRARLVARGRRALDTLETLQRALLSGEAGEAAERDLRDLGDAREPTGEAELDATLMEIDVRRAVELAKLEMSRRSPTRVQRG
jgi:hypothetical protein